MIVKEGVDYGLKRMSVLLGGLSMSNKYVWHDGEPVFTPWNSAQYAVFLYLVSNSIYREYGGAKEADLVYYLNKVMHACDWFYAIELPEIFFGEHLMGSVLGRARYGNHFFIYQGTTVGGNRDSDGKILYPVIGNHVLMYTGSCIIGNCSVGSNVILSAGTIVLNEDIPDNAIVFGKSPDLMIKRKTKEDILSMQKHIWR